MKQILFLLLSFLSITTISRGQPDTLAKTKFCQNIIEEIDAFNHRYTQEVKELLLYRVPRLSKGELDTLHIEIEPHFIVEAECRKKMVWDSSFGYPSISTLYDYFLKADSLTGTIYSCVRNPKWKNDSTRLSVRLYSSQNVQKYYATIIQPCISQFSETEIDSLVFLFRENNGLGWGFSEALPFGSKAFSLDVRILPIGGLYRCLIIGNRIYSLECMEEKYYSKEREGMSVESFLKTQLEEFRSCELDNEFSDILTHMKNKNR